MTRAFNGSRRFFISTMASATTVLAASTALSIAQTSLAQAVSTSTTRDIPTPTPHQPRGPFYPLELPLDQDNDLIKITGRTTAAQGQIAHVSGRILDERGRVIPKARVEIWQCDVNGRYHHPWDSGRTARDSYFQGYGQYITGAYGSYRFRTIKPVSYAGRAPHIHFAVTAPGAEPFTTQMYVAGAPENSRDFLLNSVPDRLRHHLIVDFAALAEAQWQGQFDIVLVADGRAGRFG